MEYAIPLGLVLLVITAAIVLLVMRSTAKGSSRADDGASGPGIGADDQSPFLDTDQHAGHQEGGRTVSDYDAGQAGGAGSSRGQGYDGTSPVGDDADDPQRAAHVKRTGEGEGAARI